MKSSFRCPLDRVFIKKTTPAILIQINLEKELVTAIELNKVEDVRDILTTGLNPSHHLFFKKQPLILALELRHWEIAAALIEKGAALSKYCGNTTALHNLAYMYRYGQGVKQDYQEALNWYHRAARKNLAEAKDSLGHMYRNGLGVEQNYAEALDWFRKAAAQGNAEAKNNLGYMYRNGLGVEQNYAEALDWYRKAAAQGCVEAKNNLGYMYRNGLGVEQNYAEALDWFRKAAAQGSAAAQNNLAYMHHNGHGGNHDRSLTASPQV